MTVQLNRWCGAALLLLGSASINAAVEAPIVTAQSGLLLWEPVDAITINVHRADGTWLESLPGNSSEWIVPEPGSYFLVGADHGDWQDWGKSNVVNANDEFVFGELDPGIDAALVADDLFNSRTDSWFIDGNTLRFAVDGWFQVADSSGRVPSFEIVCEGVLSCELDESKSYQVVNHSTGEVWQQIKVNQKAVAWHHFFGSSFSGQLQWTSVVYNHEPHTQFDVYLNDEFFTSSSIPNTPIYNLDRGTVYHATIFALLADGSTELVADDTFVTQGLLTTDLTFGRPAVDQDTFGFDAWDLIDEDTAALLPSDCLFAIPSGGYCFSPSSRYFMEYDLFDSSRPITWEFPLPGDNSTNHIEGLAHFYGGGRRGQPKEVALLADITTEFGQSRYEISVFKGVGRFTGTYPILEDLQFSAGDGSERQINLDGADLRLTLGPVIPSPSEFIFSEPRRLHIAGEYYELTGTGSRQDLSGWEQEGAFLYVLDPNTGETLSKTFYPDSRVEDVPLD